MPLELKETNHYRDSVHQVCANTGPKIENIKSMSVRMQGNSIVLGLAFINSQAAMNFIARITWRFDKKSDDRYRGSDQAEYRFTVSTDLILYKNIIVLIDEEFEKIAENNLSDILNLPQQFFGLPPVLEDPYAVSMQNALEALLPRLNPAIPDDNVLNELIAKIEPLEIHRYCKPPLYLLLANYLHERKHLYAAIYVLEEFDRKRKLSPREHAKLSALLWESFNARADEHEKRKQSTTIIAHALFGLAQMQSVKYADNSYQKQAENILREVMMSLRENNDETNELMNIMDACIKPFRSKTFKRDFFDKLYNWEDYIREVENELQLNATEVANIIIELIINQDGLRCKKRI